VVLLRGITGSGKTQIYMELIKENILLGKQVLYLVPEIALTSQLVQRIKKYFGNPIN
jgi:primosomal protein N' (replication factor Y)